MNRLATALLIALLGITGPSWSQDAKKGSSLGPADATKMVVAKQKLYAGENASALGLYRDIEKSNPQNATVKYYVGLCHYNLRQVKNAKESLLKAVALNADEKPEVHLVLGKIYQEEEAFDQAIASYNKYKGAAVADKESAEDVEVLLSQCNNAVKLMASPIDVTINNLGVGINSQYDDKNPCITADGKRLVFTTRRPENTSDPMDIEGDGKYFENIYMAATDSASGQFVKAGNVGAINTKAHDAVTSISPDGKQIFIYKNDAADPKSRGGNIFVSKVTNGKWRTPEPLGKPINSSYWEGGACISPNGRQYFFTSERKGGMGASDIWLVEKTGKNEWGKPVNLGPTVNTAYDEGGMFLAPDGKTLFFCSNGPGSMGSYDVFKTVYEKGQWSAPVNLGYPINTASREGQLTISADARYAYVSSNRKGGFGESDLYMIDLKDYAILEKDGVKKTGNGLSILKGTIREGFEGYGIQDVSIHLKDEAGNTVSSTTTNENGEYFFTLRGGRYVLTVEKKGYDAITEQIELTASAKETVVVEKGYLLKKGT